MKKLVLGLALLTSLSSFATDKCAKAQGKVEGIYAAIEQVQAAEKGLNYNLIEEKNRLFAEDKTFDSATVLLTQRDIVQPSMELLRTELDKKFAIAVDEQGEACK